MERNIERTGNLKKTEERTNLDELLVLLTPVERAILKILSMEAEPLTISDIRNKLIDDVMDKILSPTVNVYQAKNKIQPPLQFKIRIQPSEQDVFDKIRAEIKKVQPRYKKRQKTAELLRKYNILEIPAHQTIEKILNELIAAGLVLSREAIIGKKKLYVIDPKVLGEVREAIRKIESLSSSDHKPL